MASKPYFLEIMTPFSSAFQGEVEYVVGPGAGGYFGVLIDHAPFLSGLNYGELYVREAGGKEVWYAISNGFFEINQNKAVILVDTAERKDEIDVKRAEAAKSRAEKRLTEQGIDIDRAQAALQRALIRLKVAGK